MSLTPGSLLMLDTSVLIDLARNNRTGQAIEQQFALRTRADRPLLSTITEGEVLGIAKHLRYNAAKEKAVRDLLAEFVRVESGDPAIVEAYAELFLAMRQNKQNTGQNDLWIAATAKVTGAVLLTSDADFNWMNPHLIQVNYIARTP